MSNIYIQEPPALGKVLLKTSAGEIDIELWTKEAPKACRNFIQLCMEGYYNGTIFHRVVPEFIVQGGDPNGDGTGGESIYGAPFKDEFHSRLRFNRRGLVASANAGKDDNASQFFFTLGATPELQNKHTIFGKVTGETIYNVLKLSEGLIGPDDRPEHPHKIIATTVLINPFTDIEPRVSEVRVEEAPKKKKERHGVKNFGLLSFGDEAEEDETEVQEYRGKPKSTHDLLEDPKLSKLTAEELEKIQDTPPEPSIEELEIKKKQTEATVTNIRDKLTAKKRESSTDRDSKKRKDSVDRDSKRKDSVDRDSKTKHSVDRDSKRKDSVDRDSKIKDSVDRDSKRKDSADRDSKRKDSVKNEEYSGSESLEEEYYLGMERDKEIQKEKVRIRNEIKQLKKEMKGNKEQKIAEQNETEEAQKMEEDNELIKSYVEEQEKYKNMKEKIPKKGAARGRRQKVSRKPPKQRPWIKNLYENRDYPDNYTHPMFLEDLKKNIYAEKVTLFQAVIGSFRVVLRLCLCVLYAILFVYMYNELINTYTVIYISIVITFLCYVLYVYLKGSAVLRHFKTVLVYIVLGYLLSPVLHTLTDTVSTDTIFAWAVLMMIIHLIFFDYDVPAAIVSKSLSINAAIFASVCLVSRLSTPFDAFVLLTVSVIVFVLSPQFIQVYLHTKVFILVYVLTVVLTLLSLYTLSKTLLVYFVVMILVISVYCPLMFVKWQRYKDNKYGPWDEAVINDSDDLDECLGID